MEKRGDDRKKEKNQTFSEDKTPMHKSFHLNKILFLFSQVHQNKQFLTNALRDQMEKQLFYICISKVSFYSIANKIIAQPLLCLSFFFFFHNKIAECVYSKLCTYHNLCPVMKSGLKQRGRLGKMSNHCSHLKKIRDIKSS